MKTEAFRELKKCNLCSCEEYEIIYKWQKEYYPHSKFETASWDGRKAIELQIVKCKNCGLVYSNPAFKEDRLNLVYPENVLSNQKKISPEILKSTKWEDIIKHIQYYLPQNSTLVDIGTKFGALVKKLQNKGYRTFGVEYNKTSVEIAKKSLGINLINGGIPQLKNCNLTRVHAFILDDVLEHLTNPMRDIKILSNFQQKGDFLFLRQMDWDSLGHKIYKKNWYYLQPAAHTYYFNEKSITNLLKENNYSIIKIVRTPTYKNWIKFLSNTVKPQNKSKNYLSTRKKLSDMFLVIAKKN